MIPRMRYTSRVRRAAPFLLLAAMAVGCHLIGGANGYFIEEDGSGGASTTTSQGGGTTTSSSTTSTSSAGGAPECMDDIDCPGEIAPCAKPQCDLGRCEIDFLAARTACSEGIVANGLCDGGGICKECLENGDCNTAVMETCDGGTCVAPVCSDESKNGDETDVDCGGPICAACPNGAMCMGPDDCETLVCNGSNLCTYCENESECPTNHYCSVGSDLISVQDNTCKAKLGQFQPCAVDYQCLSGNCNILCQ